MRRVAVLGVVLFGWVWGVVAQADCCRVVKTDAEPPTSTVRICERGPNNTCWPELVTSTFAEGDDENVCSAGNTIVYQELDPALGSYKPPIVARCTEGSDVEL